jgi:membrane-associated phospholipid phosphatase
MRGSWLALVCALAAPFRATAAQATCAASGEHVVSPQARIGLGVLLVASTALDTRLRDEAVEQRRPTLDRAARVLDPLGRAGVLVPALVGSIVAPKVLGMHAMFAHSLRVAIGYAASDGVESLLKPLVGRHRPSDGGGPWRFAPLRNDGDWHSFPSAHTVHAFSIAAGIADESRSPWLSRPAYGLAGAVGLQRIYTEAHWSSDVIASAALAQIVSSATNRFVREHGIARLLHPETRCRP